jgi:hypothetical protein
MIALPRLIKSAYRREPIVSILITMGIIDALIGGFDDSWSLFGLGLGTASLALLWRFWRFQQRPSPLPEEEPAIVQRYLPSRSSASSSALPMLSVSKKKPPH